LVGEKIEKAILNSQKGGQKQVSPDGRPTRAKKKKGRKMAN